jgi:hypothetical protein
MSTTLDSAYLMNVALAERGTKIGSLDVVRARSKSKEA